MSTGPIVTRGIDYVELYVSNALQAAHFYRNVIGLAPTAYAGLQTGVRDRSSRMLTHGGVTLILTSPLSAEFAPEIALHIHRHGDSAKDIAFRVDNAAAAHDRAVQRGARSVSLPHVATDKRGRLVRSTIATFGDTVHSFIERDDYHPWLLPGYEEAPPNRPAIATQLDAIDHLVACVEAGQMAFWVDFYKDVFGFNQFAYFDEHSIGTKRSALSSTVVANEDRSIMLAINQPARGAHPGQIDEFLSYNGGPGIQHLALATADILATVDAIRAAGVDFLTVPAAYYRDLSKRIGPIDESIDDLATRGIMADCDTNGYLLQLFTQPLQDRPTLFLEIICRRGCGGFGQRNFKTLFEAVEREQHRRGNL